MADSKISDLTAASAAAVANMIEINEAGTSKRISITQLVTLLQTLGMPVVVTLGSDYTNSTTTGTEITGLQFTIGAAGTYRVRWMLLVRADATTTSPVFGVNYTGTASPIQSTAFFPSAGVNAATGQIASNVNATTGQVWAYASTATESTTVPNLGPWTGMVSVSTNALMIIEALFVCSTTGDLELWASSEISTSVVSVMTGSSGTLIRTA